MNAPAKVEHAHYTEHAPWLLRVALEHDATPDSSPFLTPASSILSSSAQRGLPQPLLSFPRPRRGLHGNEKASLKPRQTTSRALGENVKWWRHRVVAASSGGGVEWWRANLVAQVLSQVE